MECAYSCDNQPSELEPYADISGLGIIISFVVAAYMVVGLLLIYYILIFDPRLDPFRKSDDNETKATYVNPVDDFVLNQIWTSRLFSKYFSWRFHHEQFQGGRLQDTLNKCVLALADMQIITGFAILISGFHSLQCRLSAYHWQVIVYLAWLSSLTHQSALTFLRHYLHNRRGEYISRVVLMLSMVLFLISSNIPTAFFDFDGEDGYEDFKPSNYAVCYYHRKIDTDRLGFQSMLIFIFLATYGYTIRVAKMSSSLMKRSHRFMTWIGNRYTGGMELWDPLASPRSWKKLSLEVFARPLYIAFLGVVMIQLNLFSSFLAETYWLIIALSWATLSLFSVREHGPSSEGTFTFGQVLPLIMLAAPVVSVSWNLIDYFRSPNYLAIEHTNRDMQREEGSGARGNSSSSRLPESKHQQGSGSQTVTNNDSSTRSVLAGPLLSRPASAYTSIQLRTMLPGDVIRTRIGDHLPFSLHPGVREQDVPSTPTPLSKWSSPLPQWSPLPQQSQPLQLRESGVVLFEDSKAFSGGLALAALSYLEYGLFFLLNRPRGLLAPLIWVAIDALVYQPLIQMSWILYVLWFEKIDVTPHLQSLYRNLMLGSLLAMSFISNWWFSLYFISELLVLSIMVGLYMIACVWIECELRFPPKVRLLARFFFASIFFTGATVGYYFYQPIKSLIAAIFYNYQDSFYKTGDSVYMPSIYGTLSLLSLGTLANGKFPGLFKRLVVSLTKREKFGMTRILITFIFQLSPWAVMTLLFFKAMYGINTFVDTIHLLLAIISINSFPVLFFTICGLYEAFFCNV